MSKFTRVEIFVYSEFVEINNFLGIIERRCLLVYSFQYIEMKKKARVELLNVYNLYYPTTSHNIFPCFCITKFIIDPLCSVCNVYEPTQSRPSIKVSVVFIVQFNLLQ